MPSKVTGKLTDEIGFSLPSFTGGQAVAPCVLIVCSPFLV